MNESQMTLKLLDGLKTADDFADYDVESHYNHFGSRGAVDLVVEYERDKKNTLELYELKSESALNQATGANEIIRQFKRHRSYFFEENDDYPRRAYGHKTFWLLFYATEATVEHLNEFAELYQSIENTGYCNTLVGLYHEDFGKLHLPPNGDVGSTDAGAELVEVVSE